MAQSSSTTTTIAVCPTKLHPVVANYLRELNSLKKMRDDLKQARLHVQELEKKVYTILSSTRSKQQNVRIDEQHCDVYGNCIALRAVEEKKKECFSKGRIKEMLITYFQKRFFNSQSQEAIEEFATDTANYLWNERSFKTSCTVKLQYPRKRKGEEEEEEDYNNNNPAERDDEDPLEEELTQTSKTSVGGRTPGRNPAQTETTMINNNDFNEDEDDDPYEND